MKPSHHLGDLQHAIMQVLWEEGEATVSRVHEVLRRDRRWRRALTTIATMLSKMETKGVVEHRVEGRQFVYRPTVSERTVRTSMVTELTRRLFGGDVTALVGHLLADREIDRGELERLRAMIEKKRREEGR